MCLVILDVFQNTSVLFFSRKRVVCMFRGFLLILALIVWVMPLFALHLLATKVAQELEGYGVDDDSISIAERML